LIFKEIENIDIESLGLNIPFFWFEESGFNGNDIKGFFNHQLKYIQDYKISDKKEKPVFLQLFMNHFTSYKGKTGTLLKAILILPMLRRLGFNHIMLLPHFLRSDLYKKGDAGSPYSVKDYYRVDPELSEVPNMSSEQLFKTFLKAAHKLNMKVLIDMVPRTAARDSLWILEEPDWFYWIKPDDSYRLIELLQTNIKGLPVPAFPGRDNGKIAVKNMPIKEISKLFSYSPKRLYPERWDRFVSENKDNPDFMSALTDEFGLVTPPCTSDCANDPQPPWTDVTPLRLYEDYDPLFYDELGKDFLDNTPPFFVQFILKASVFKGNSPMIRLWDKISGVCSFYSKEYGVDGVRGDMFHALPDELIAKIVKEVPNDFILIMENLDNKAGEELSIKHGFDYYTGNLFTVIDENAENIRFFIDEISKFKTKILALPVIGDSPPIFSKGFDSADFKLRLSSMLPNASFGMTADTILQNTLPLNFGLGFSEEDQIEFKKKMNDANRKVAYFNHDFLDREWDEMNMDKFDYIKNIIKKHHEIMGDDDWKLDKVSINDNIVSYTLISNGKRLLIDADFDKKNIEIKVS